MRGYTNRKIWIALGAFVLCVIFVGWIIYDEYLRTGCIYLVQKAEFASKYAVKNQDGSVTYPWESGYKCVFNPRVIGMLITAGLISLIVSINTLKKHKVIP